MGLLVSPGELTNLRVYAASTLDLPCTIQRKPRTADGMGSTSGVYGTIATVNAGLAQPNAGQLQNYATEIGSLSVWQVHLPFGTDVARQDRLLIGTHTLEVQVFYSPESYAVLVTALASEIQ